MAIKESTHWYDGDGKPAYTVIGKNGRERNTTLRDAREMNLYPSVTTIINVAAKPSLENWKIDQALMAALTLPERQDESLDDFIKRAKQDAKEQGIKAAQRGTEIHAQIEAGFSGKDSSAYQSVRSELNSLFPSRDWIAEGSFASDIGFGGKIDLYGEDVFVDFKTKDGLPDKAPVYDEHGIQLSAYAAGMGVSQPQRLSIFIDRNDPTKVLSHLWDEDSHQKHLQMFLSLLTYWQASKGYKPSISIKDEENNANISYRIQRL